MPGSSQPRDKRMRKRFEPPIGYMDDYSLQKLRLAFPPAKMLTQSERREIRSLWRKIHSIRRKLSLRIPKTNAKATFLRAQIGVLYDQQHTIAMCAWEREMQMGAGTIVRLESTTEKETFELARIELVTQYSGEILCWGLCGYRLRKDGTVGVRKVCGMLTDLKLKQKQSDGTWTEVLPLRRRRPPVSNVAAQPMKICARTVRGELRAPSIT